MACPDENALSELALGLLASPAREAVTEHLATCDGCRVVVARLVASATPPPLELAPTHLSPRADDDATPFLRPDGAFLEKGSLVGRYVVLGPVGAGGMGVVYSAYDPQLDRKVALKLMHADERRKVSVEELKLRLMREAQAMARLSHPHVLPIYDVGTFGAGAQEQVFVALEFVEGGSLREWLRTRRHWREVLELFLRAGEGLAAAHAAGLVHRDFKPDNVLVSPDGRVRVTDFGLAALVSDDEPSLTPSPRPPRLALPVPPELTPDRPLSLDHPLTVTGTLLGTPAYMAPELLYGRPDTRSDQFAFCVSLYEALYGARPFAGENVVALARAANLGQVAPPPEGAAVPGWLRRVLVKGLSGTPSSRYPTMNALLSALRTRPRRRRALVAAGVAAGLLVVGGLGVREVRAQRAQLCQGGPRQIARVWNDEARAQLHRAFLATGKAYGEAASQSAQSLLNRYAADWVAMHQDACEATRLRGEQTEAQLALRMECLDGALKALGALSRVFGQADAQVAQNARVAAAALPPVEACGDLEALGRAGGRAPPVALHAAVEAGEAQVEDARARRWAGQYKEGLALAEKAVADARLTGWAPLLARALEVEGELRVQLADYPGAQARLLEAAAAAEGARLDEASAQARLEMVDALALQNRMEDAQAWLTLARGAVDRLGPGHELMRARLRFAEGRLAREGGKVEQAVAALREAATQAERALGPDDLTVADYAYELGVALMEADQLDEAQRVQDRVLALRRKLLGEEHPTVAASLSDLAIILKRSGKYEEAERLYLRALAIDERAVGPYHPDIAVDLNNLGALHNIQGHDAQAEAYYRRAVEVQEKALGPEHPSFAFFLLNVCSSRADDASLATCRRALGIIERKLGPEHPSAAHAHRMVASVLAARADVAGSLAEHQRALAIYEKAVGPTHSDTAREQLAVGEALFRLKGIKEAAPYFEKALATLGEGSHNPEQRALTRYWVAYARYELGAQRGPALAMAEEASRALAPVAQTPKLVFLNGWLAKRQKER